MAIRLRSYIEGGQYAACCPCTEQADPCTCTSTYSMTCRSASGVATLCGFPPFGEDSPGPPRRWRRREFSGEGAVIYADLPTCEASDGGWTDGVSERPFSITHFGTVIITGTFSATMSGNRIVSVAWEIQSVDPGGSWSYNFGAIHSGEGTSVNGYNPPTVSIGGLTADGSGLSGSAVLPSPSRKAWIMAKWGPSSLWSHPASLSVDTIGRACEVASTLSGSCSHARDTCLLDIDREVVVASDCDPELSGLPSPISDCELLACAPDGPTRCVREIDTVCGSAPSGSGWRYRRSRAEWIVENTDEDTDEDALDRATADIEWTDQPPGCIHHTTFRNSRGSGLSFTFRVAEVDVYIHRVIEGAVYDIVVQLHERPLHTGGPFLFLGRELVVKGWTPDPHRPHAPATIVLPVYQDIELLAGGCVISLVAS